MSTLEKAIEIAARAHTGQKDKAGNPYICHPLRLMLAVRGDVERITAVLHDVVEDSPVTLDDLRREGFADPVIAAVEALTKRPGESRLDAGRRAKADPIARVVKLVDLADNTDLTRMASLTERDHERLREYQQVRALLLADEGAA